MRTAPSSAPPHDQHRHVARLPVVLCVDVEPDDRWVDPKTPAPWRGFERSLEVLQAFRAETEHTWRRPAHVTWVFRLDPQVADTYGRPDWPLTEYASRIGDLIAAGDEIGVHTHAYRWNPVRGGWMLDHGTQSWIEHCVDMSLDAFNVHFGRPARTFRFGDRWMNTETMARLEHLGVRYDLTLEPGQPAQPTYEPNHAYTGSLPDYTSVPDAPFHPGGDDFRRPDESDRSGLVAIPITTAPVRRSPLRRLYDRSRGLPSARVTTALVSLVPVTFRQIVDHALARPRTRHLAIVVRSGAFAEARYARRIRANLTMLSAHPRAGEFLWVTPEEAMSALWPLASAGNPSNQEADARR